MPHEIPTAEPTELTAGEDWRWDRAFGEHPPADGWTLRYALRGPTDTDITAQAAEGVYQVRVGIAQTETVEAGLYRLVGYVDRGDPVQERVVVYDAQLLVRPNPLAPVNAKSAAERTLAAIEAAIEGRLTNDLAEEVTINGRSIKSISIRELVRLRGIYAERVRLERNPGQLGQRVEVHFARPR